MFNEIIIKNWKIEKLEDKLTERVKIEILQGDVFSEIGS